ncbi:MAG: class II glutamine amidotransferase [Candidatus Heimdallarchaeaceae archaeon]
MCRIFLFLGKRIPKEAFDEFIQACADYPDMPKKDLHEHNRDKTLDHADGFGYSYLDEKSSSFVTEHFPEPIFELSNNLFPKLEKKHLLLVHARKASPGIEINLQNNHPFQIAFHEQDFVFAHNGTIKSEIKFNEELFKPKGTTDSEKYFYAILTSIAENDFKFSKKKFETLIADWQYTGANFILANSQHILVGVYHKESPNYYTMKLYKNNDFIIICSSYLPTLGDPKLLANGEVIKIDIATKKIEFLEE